MLEEKEKNVKRKTLLISLILLASISVIRVEASPVVTVLSVAPLKYVAEVPGETFGLDVNVADVANLYAFEFKLGYNTTLLDVVQVVQGSFFPPPPESSIEKLEINETGGLVWVRMSLSDTGTPENESSTLASIIFNVTQPPVSPTKTCCALNLYDTALYDDAMASIPHYSVDGLYFWRSMLDDPDEDTVIDLITQKGGKGQGEPSPPFVLGELVELTALLTCGGSPQIDRLVAFEVTNPNNVTVVTRTGITGKDGIATIDFRIPALPESLGTWTAITISESCGVTVWDSITFTVSIQPPPPSVGGKIAPIVISVNKLELYDPYVALTVLLAVVATTVVYVKKRKKV